MSPTVVQPDRPSANIDTHDEPVSLLELLLPLVAAWRWLVLAPLAAGLTALAVTYLLQPTFTSRTVFLPPQQQQSAAAAAVAQLGALGGLAGAATGIKSPADQYVSLLQSVNVTDRLIDEFKLLEVYDLEYRFEARRALAQNMRVLLGKKDGLITIEVEDKDPRRAAAIANRGVEELRRLTNELALTEAQQRRAFFENQLRQARDRLTQAQQTLQASGFNPSALKADARAEAENYARLRAEATGTEVRLQTLRRNLADGTPEVQQALTTLGALRGQLARLEAPVASSGGPDYIGKFREFKYQESLFELFARQYELARIDESREGALIQVVDVAKPAEWKSSPKRLQLALIATVLVGFLLLVWVTGLHLWRRAATAPENAERIAALRTAWK